jgi:UDP-N-acetylmuramate--alanine ligase
MESLVTRPRTSSETLPASDRFEIASKSIYMLGIGGSGMTGLARMLKSRGARVSGADMAPSEAIRALEAEGITIGFDQTKAWLPDSCDYVVASAAIKPDHPQMLEATRRSIPTLSYAEALGKCMLGRSTIAIAGTHGKSTTTAMLGCALTDAGLDPTVIVGATCAQLTSGTFGPPTIPTGFRLGSDRIPRGGFTGAPGIVVAESCEFNRSFHNYRPHLASISSVEADHLDVYGTLDAVVESFHEFAKLIAPADEGGKLIIAHDGAHRREVTAGLTCAVETIGFSPQADWVVNQDPKARLITLTRGKDTIARFRTRVHGAHNAFNACVALALGVGVGGDPDTLAGSLSGFAGIDRRMQLLGERRVSGHGGGTVRVYDDYGHHPTEVDVTLRALRDAEKPQERGGRLICVFQPHQHSRTRHLLDEFASAFSSADVVIVPHIYFVRDSQEEKQRVTAADLVDRLRDKGIRAMHVYPFGAIVEQLETLCRPGDMVVCMGAGNVNEVARLYLAAGGIA